MDLALFLRVLKRRWPIVVGGVALAVVVALVATFRVAPGESPPVSFRENDEYVSRTSILVTQAGFPWGRLFVDEPAPGEAPRTEVGPSLLDAQRLASLPALYSEFVESDQVRAIMEESLPDTGWTVEADPVLDQTSQSGQSLPIMIIAGIAESPELAERVATTANESLRTYVERLQERNEILARERVLLQTIERPKDAEIFTSRSMTLPIVAFLAVLVLTVLVAFAVENLSRGTSRRPEPGDEPSPLVPSGGYHESSIPSHAPPSSGMRREKTASRD